MTSKDAANWAGIRLTDKNAVPIGWAALPIGARCVFVTKGSIRGAVVSGYFQVADVLNPNSTRAGRQRIQVVCHWYGKKPKTTWMNLTVSKSGCEDMKNYSGDVICNIGRN